MEISDHAITGGFSDIGEIVKSSFGSIDKLYEQGREVTGLATHYIEFDRMTSGLQDSELIIIAARPSMGKTAWAINIAQNAAVQRRQGRRRLLARNVEGDRCCAVCSPARRMVNSRKIQTGFLPKEDKGKLMSALERLMESKMFIDDTPGITLAEMRAKARRLKQQEGRLDLIVIDYLQLMTGSAGPGKKGFENRNQEVAAVSRGLKALAKEMKVPVVALSQLSRASEQRGGDKKPMLSDLRESGSIEQDADVVCFIHRDELLQQGRERRRRPVRARPRSSSPSSVTARPAVSISRICRTTRALRTLELGRLRRRRILAASSSHRPWNGRFITNSPPTNLLT